MSDLKMRGIDLGNWRCHLMSGRFFDYFFDLMKLEVKTHMSQIKCLLGRKFSDPELQLELDYIPFRVIEGPNGCALVHSKCNGEDRAFTSVEILAMLLSSPEFSAINEYSDAPPCIGIPIYFTDQQKKDVLQAAQIAGLPASFCLLDETIAMVLALESDYYPKPKGIVAFVDIGHASMQVCFAEFKEDHPTRTRSLNILYKGYARSLGGREFDKVLFKHFACKIREEYDIDVSKSSSASFQLNEACVSLKNKLSETNEAFFSEKFLGSVDVMGSITRKEFETLSISILKKIKVALKKALNESGLIVKQIGLIKLVGNGCSIPAIINILTKIFGEKIRNIVSFELVARGCAVQATQQSGEKYGFWTERRIHDLETTGLETSELISETEDLDQQFLWRRAMHEEGHLLTFLNDFLEKNMHRIGRSEKTDTESHWLSKATYNFNEREMSALQRELSEAQKLREQLMSERDDARKEVEELRRLTEQQAQGSPCVGSFAEYSYSELQHATNNFHESCKLGEGGFGKVYKGILHNTTIAIKIPKEGSSQGEKEFHQEVELLSKLRHPNLVKLIGACEEAHALIYEYLPNGSLEDRLRCKNNTSPLPWLARVCIASEICSALIFLHCSEPHGIVHGDLKPDNILLDENDTSKICDFGLCRELNWTTSASIPYHWTDYPKGTFPYMDPEYFSTGKITPQFDVYSFGILLLRLATCKSPMGICHLVEEAQNKGTLKALIDASAGPRTFREFEKLISLGLRCSDRIGKNRPDLSTKVLKQIKSMLLVANYIGEYSYSELQEATNNFDESFQLGEGGFGIVYKGIINNTTVAIKILKEESSIGAKVFHQEIEILSKLRHPNLVTLLGACGEKHAVIYEYLPNGSLEDCLRCKNNTSPLTWQARTQIAFEICSALSFLHCSKPHGIVHGDLKPDNILLDLNNATKISNFGLCRELKWTASASVPYHWTDCPKGTLAYMDPDFLSIGKLTPQYDVYSFGIILFRLVTFKHPWGIRNLVEEAQKKGTLKALIDASAGPWPFKEAKKMISLGLRCSDPKRKNRPDMSHEVWTEMQSMAENASASASS